MRNSCSVSVLMVSLLLFTASALHAQNSPAADPFGPAPAADPFGAAPAADPFGPGPAVADPFAPVLVVTTDFNRLAWWVVTGASNQALNSYKPSASGLKIADASLPEAVLSKLSPTEFLAYQLERPIKLSLNQNKLADLAEALQTKLRINVIFDKKSLEEAAFDTATPIDWMTEQPIKLRDALRLLLRDLALTYITDEGTLVITTRTAAENRQIVRTYPVDPDLLRTRKRLRTPSFGQFGGDGGGLFNLKQLGGWWMPGTGSGGGFGGGSGPPLHAEYQELDSLVNLITGIVQPVTWKTNGGMGDIQPNLQLGLLVVSNTEEVHDELAALLDVFKQKMAERKPPPVSPDAIERVVHPVVLPAVRLKQQNPLDHHRPISREPAFTMEQLVEQVKKQIEPASWANPQYSISSLGQNLIVNQTRANQEKIVALLKQLGITKEQVDDEKQFAEEQEQARKDLELRQAQERERLEQERIKRNAEEQRKRDERAAAEERKREEEQRKKKEKAKETAKEQNNRDLELIDLIQ